MDVTKYILKYSTQFVIVRERERAVDSSAALVIQSFHSGCL